MELSRQRVAALGGPLPAAGLVSEVGLSGEFLSCQRREKREHIQLR